MIKAILKTMKVNHYLKNTLVFIPLLFSMSVFKPYLFFRSIVIFISFCLISSVVYIFNDIVDADSDRKHPLKNKRPIASGELPIKIAIAVLVLLLAGSLYLSFRLGFLPILMILIYLILNIFYSLKLKNLALIDVTCIALGFILRVLAGCYAIMVIPSPLVILLTFFASMFFTYSKRKLELKLLKNGDKCRASLKDFDEPLINQFVIINAVLSIAFYFTYVLDAQTIARAGTPYLYVTVLPFTLVVYRLLLLINKSNNDDPIVFFERDNTLKFLFASYFIVLFAVLLF